MSLKKFKLKNYKNLVGVVETGSSKSSGEQLTNFF